MLFTKFSAKNIGIEYTVSVHTKIHFLFLIGFLLAIKTDSCDSSSIQRTDFAAAVLLVPLEKPGYGCRHDRNPRALRAQLRHGNASAYSQKSPAHAPRLATAFLNAASSVDRRKAGYRSPEYSELQRTAKLLLQSSSLPDTAHFTVWSDRPTKFPYTE